ncbi:hypothetical protein CEXT_431001 [Caerostris extrusa]|uniref:Uncharacterized protein n=1 Tax=Caerostris extrusa TaxID=172846 RepID=A0AAV4WXR1_CAEEX|nr:hypothetical protein CEXT_431001 [Caerostris extrusa]
MGNICCFLSHVRIIKSGCISVSQIRLRIHKLIVIIPKYHPCDFLPCQRLININIAFAVAGEDAAPSWLPGARFPPCVQNEFINCLHSSLARGLSFTYHHHH